MNRTSTLIKLACAGGAKIAAAFASFVVTILVTQNMAKDDAGLFLLALTLLSVLSVLLRLGLDNVVLRFLSSHGACDYSLEKLNLGLIWIATLAFPVASLGMIFSVEIATFVFNKPEFAPVLYWAMLALPCMALYWLLSFAFQSQNKFIFTTLFQNLGVSVLFILGYFILWFFLPYSIDAEKAIQIYAVGAILIFIAAIFIWFGQPGILFRVTKFLDMDLANASMNLWMASCMSLAVQWAGILIAGAMLSAEELALLSAAVRTAFLTSFVLIIVNMVVAPRYAKMWRDKKYSELKILAKWSTRGMILMVVPIVLLMLLFPHKIMSLFGSGFDKAAPLLMILAVGQLINVATGSVAYLLTMSGHEKDFNRVTLATGPIAIVLALILTHLYGALGAAVATAVGVALQNIGAAILVKIRLGFTPLFIK